MSFALQNAIDSVNVMNPQEKLTLFQYLIPKLDTAAEQVAKGLHTVRSVPDLGEGPTASQVLTEMRDARDFARFTTNDPDANWKRLQELGREMDRQVTGGPSLMDILTEMRG